jgi:acetylglutamate/LysW-gamma-L-alpha-aminoadipate kinase
VDDSGKKKLIDGGYTGKISRINSDLLTWVLNCDMIPVISPVALGEDSELLNVDGDRVSSSIASEMKADRLVLLTDTPGVKINNEYVSKMSIYQAEAAQEIIRDGMVTKVYSATEAVKEGVNEVIIASGLIEKPISNALIHKKCTVITK